MGIQSRRIILGTKQGLIYWRILLNLTRNGEVNEDNNILKMGVVLEVLCKELFWGSSL